jgi:hypothetical protein
MDDNLPDLEENYLQCFPNEENKSKLLEMVCDMSFENINEETLKFGYRVVHVNWASST